MPAGRAQGGVPGAKPPDGPCPELAEYWHSRYGHLLGASEFSVTDVAVKGRTAEAMTPFGRVGLEVVSGEWKLLWVTV